MFLTLPSQSRILITLYVWTARMTDIHPENELGRYATAGIEFIVVVALFTGGGYWLDSRLGMLPVWTLVGLAVGFAAGLYRLVRIAIELNQKNIRRDDSGGPEEM